MPYKPPYDLTPEMLDLLKEINRLIGRIEGYQLLSGNLKLRRVNKIKSLHSSLAIEGNSLSKEQVTAIIDGKRVLGKQQDIHEVQNAIKVYDRLEQIDPFSEDELLDIHQLLMSGLITDAGRYRNSGVGVIDGSIVVHLAPPAKQVPSLMGDLFDYLNNYLEDIIIKSCVFHYEFEFIHPFSDGNGRMGRLWQTAILKTKYPDLAAVPLESIIHDRQQGYYDALLQSQRVADSNPFILFSLRALHDALAEQINTTVAIPQNYADRLSAWKTQIGESLFSRKDYQIFHKAVAPATATRDLAKGVEEGVLSRTGAFRTTLYKFATSRSNQMI